MEQEPAALLHYVLQVCQDEHQQQQLTNFNFSHDAWALMASRVMDSYCEKEGDDDG